MKKLLIEGMSCSHCTGFVEKTLKELGAKNVEVNLDGKCALVNIDLDEAKLKEVIDDAGYELVGIEEV